MILFALGGTRPFGERVAAHLGTGLSAHEEREFEDGEHKARPLVSVRGCDAYVIHSLYGDAAQSVHDKLCRLLFFLATLRDHGAARVTAVAPYLAYARKDRQTKARDPVTTQYVARLLEAAGADCVVTLEVHNLAAYQNAFRCRSIHLDAGQIFAAHVRAMGLRAPIVVASPDPGGVKRAQLFRERLEGLGLAVGQAFVDKRRSAGIVSGDTLVGDVAGASVVIVDDIIASGGTITRAARAAIEHGARETHAFAAHGLFTGDAQQQLAAAPLARTVVTDSVPPFRLEPSFVSSHIEVLSATSLFAEAIARLHDGGSIAELMAGT